jgi:ATP-dependent Clp protease adaptor protein ClpS
MMGLPMNEDKEKVAVAPAPAKPQEAKPKRDPKYKPQPPYAVIVLNDDDHTYAYVIEGLIKYCNHKFERAFELAKQVDRTGSAVVWTGTLELAELKRDQLRGMGPDFYAARLVTYPLGVKLEPMPG